VSGAIAAIAAAEAIERRGRDLDKKSRLSLIAQALCRRGDPFSSERPVIDVVAEHQFN
jgi:hypothetical protein